MSLLSTIESFWGVSEVFVMNLVVKAKTDIAIIESDIEKAWNWIAAHSSEISSDAAMVANGIAALKAAGVPIPAVATTAIADMNKAVTVLNAAVGASDAGGNALQIFIAGYQASKQAQSAVAQAAGAITTAVPAAAASPATAPASSQGSGG